MGRVDEGVEEFFTKKVLPTETLKKEDEEEEEETITVHEVAPVSTVPCPPPTKTLRRKLGDFFTLKKRRGLKSEPSQEGRPKKTSIADFIRPLREVARGEKDKDKDKVKEHDKENEKEKGKDSSDAGDTVQGISISDAPPMRGEAVPPRRALREGKSQSLILLSGSASGAGRNKKLEGQNSFEQKLHLMLQRIGVSKPQTGETQNPEGEMKKAESEGTIIDNKQDPPSTKPRTMSASSDTRHPLRSSVSAHESAGKPPLLPKPVLKPAPTVTVSGRTTPENELGQSDGQPNTEAAPVVSTSSTPPVATISDTAPDSTTDLPSSTVIPPDTHECTDIREEATAPPDISEQDKTVIPESTTEPHSATIEDTLTITTPATPSNEPDALELTKTSTTIETTPPSPTLENISAPSDNNTTTGENMSTELITPEPDAVINAASTSTSISDTPAVQSVNVVTTASNETTPCTQAISANVSQGDKTALESPCLSDSLTPSTSTTAVEVEVATTVCNETTPCTQAESGNISEDDKTASEAPCLSDSPIILTSTAAETSCALPETTSAICTAAKTETPAITTCTISPSVISSTSTGSPATISIISISTSSAHTTEMSQTTTMSPGCSLLMTNSELPLSTAITPDTVDVSTTEFQNVPSDCLATHGVTGKHSDQEHELQTSPEASVVECSVIVTEEIVVDVDRETEEPKTTENNEKSDSSKESEEKTEEPTVVSCAENELKEETDKLNYIEGAEIEPAKGASDELCGDEIMNVEQKQSESTSCDEK